MDDGLRYLDDQADHADDAGCDFEWLGHVGVQNGQLTVVPVRFVIRVFIGGSR